MRTKITAFVAPTAAFAAGLVLIFTPLASGDNSETGPLLTAPLTANFVGLGGMAFRPGQNVDISWILKGKEVSNLEANPWSECELFFSADGGKTWSRVTPQLSVTTRSYEWTIPDVLTGEGLIGLQIGIEGEGELYFFPSESFTVLAERGLH